jgi:HEAT repeat protein
MNESESIDFEELTKIDYGDALLQLSTISPSTLLVAIEERFPHVDVETKTLCVRLLGDLGWPVGYALLPESVAILQKMAASEDDEAVLESIIEALGSRREPSSAETVVSFRRHESDFIRTAVARALPALVNDTNYREIEDVLVELSSDENVETREFATAALSRQLLLTDVEAYFQDSKVTLSALKSRLSDMEAEIRGEALLGLASRLDPDVVHYLEEELTETNVSSLALQAAAITSDSRLLGLLERLSSWWIGDPNEIEVALAACR